MCGCGSRRFSCNLWSETGLPKNIREGLKQKTQDHFVSGGGPTEVGGHKSGAVINC